MHVCSQRRDTGNAVSQGPSSAVCEGGAFACAKTDYRKKNDLPHRSYAGCAWANPVGDRSLRTGRTAEIERKLQVVAIRAATTCQVGIRETGPLRAIASRFPDRARMSPADGAGPFQHAWPQISLVIRGTKYLLSSPSHSSQIPLSPTHSAVRGITLETRSRSDRCLGRHLILPHAEQDNR